MMRSSACWWCCRWAGHGSGAWSTYDRVVDVLCSNDGQQKVWQIHLPGQICGKTPRWREGKRHPFNLRFVRLCSFTLWDANRLACYKMGVRCVMHLFSSVQWIAKGIRGKMLVSKKGDGYVLKKWILLVECWYNHVGWRFVEITDGIISVIVDRIIITHQV